MSAMDSVEEIRADLREHVKWERRKILQAALQSSGWPISGRFGILGWCFLSTFRRRFRV